MNLEQEILELKNRVSLLEQLLTKKNTENELVNIPATNQRDKTKYIFNGKILPKNRLVWNIVNVFIQQNNPDFFELSKNFDKSLQGSLGVFMKLEDVKKISDAPKRFFIRENEIFTLKDNSKIAVCTQWGAFNIVKFIKQAENLGFKIEKI